MTGDSAAVRRRDGSSHRLVQHHLDAPLQGRQEPPARNHVPRAARAATRVEDHVQAAGGDGPEAAPCQVRRFPAAEPPRQPPPAGPNRRRAAVAAAAPAPAPEVPVKTQDLNRDPRRVARWTPGWPVSGVGVAAQVGATTGAGTRSSAAQTCLAVQLPEPARDILPHGACKVDS